MGNGRAPVIGKALEVRKREALEICSHRSSLLIQHSNVPGGDYLVVYTPLISKTYQATY